MTGFRAGEVVSVEFPFTDMQGRKRRPGVVLAVDVNDVLLASVTTHEPRDTFDVPLMGWAAVSSGDARGRMPQKNSRQGPWMVLPAWTRGRMPHKSKPAGAMDGPAGVKEWRG
jgi:hypothetical protein